MPLADGGYVVLEVNGAVDCGAQYSLAARDAYRDAAEAIGLAPRLAAAAGRRLRDTAATHTAGRGRRSDPRSLALGGHDDCDWTVQPGPLDTRT